MPPVSGTSRSTRYGKRTSHSPSRRTTVTFTLSTRSTRGWKIGVSPFARIRVATSSSSLASRATFAPLQSTTRPSSPTIAERDDLTISGYEEASSLPGDAGRGVADIRCRRDVGELELVAERDERPTERRHRRRSRSGARSAASVNSLAASATS